MLRIVICLNISLLLPFVYLAPLARTKHLTTKISQKKPNLRKKSKHHPKF